MRILTIYSTATLPRLLSLPHGTVDRYPCQPQREQTKSKGNGDDWCLMDRLSVHSQALLGSLSLLFILPGTSKIINAVLATYLR